MKINRLFEGPLDLEYLDGKNYRLTVDFNYKTKSGIDIKVPAGFETDFASIPRALWSFLDPTDRVIGKAAVIHDYLYHNGGIVPKPPVPNPLLGYNLTCSYETALLLNNWVFSKYQSDQILRDAMIELGASQSKANTVYWAVRLFGGSSWKGPR